MTGRMREVELVDEVDVPVPAAPAEGREPSARRSWRRRHAVWLVPTAALVVAALVGTQAVLDARERSRGAALAEVPGVIAPTGPGIGVVWRAAPELGPVLQGGSMVDGLLVGGTTATDGGVHVLALDLSTGVTRWSTPVTLPTAHPDPDGQVPSSAVTCTEIPRGGRPLAGCLSQQYGANIVGLPDQTIWVLDPTDGHVLSTRTVTGTSGVTFTRDAVVVASRVDAAGAPARADASSVRWNVAATDALDGAGRWTYTTPAVDVLGREDGPSAADASGGASMTTFGDQVVLSVDTDAWVLDDDGTLVRDVPLSPGSWLQGARAGAYVLSGYATDGQYSGALLLADGTKVPMDQTAAWLAVDDGSASDVVLTAGDGPTGVLGLSGRDAATGKILWHKNDAVTTALVLDGVVYIGAFSEITAVDAHTGDVLWTTEVEHQFRELSTDGRYLLVPGQGISLDAYSIADGSHAWSADLRAAVSEGKPTQAAQGFQSGGTVPRLLVWMNDGAAAVLG